MEGEQEGGATPQRTERKEGQHHGQWKRRRVGGAVKPQTKEGKEGGWGGQHHGKWKGRRAGGSNTEQGEVHEGAS